VGGEKSAISAPKGAFLGFLGKRFPGKAMPPAPGKSQNPAGEKIEHAFPERLFLGDFWGDSGGECH
jgi:hypothetical protein